jgi:hypothetical protein
VQEPLAYYRLHGQNRGNLQKNEEVDEMEVWLNENELNLTISQIKKIKQKNNYKRFINYKIDRKYKKCVNVLFNQEMGILKIKSIIVLFIPIIILKKLLWFYQD